ncbi:MAG: hypothetical protein HWE16_14305 [Gammaproteobacteria bacterium]|nr:hypothetical protein [Gammaproteobacteria bacterium]
MKFFLLNNLLCSKVSAGVAVLLLWVSFTQPVLAESWKIKRFEVVTVEPTAHGYKMRHGVARHVRNLLDIDIDGAETEFWQVIKLPEYSTVIEDIETEFSKAADFFEAAGFREPDIEPIIRKKKLGLTEGDAYRIYLVKGLENGTAAGIHQPYSCDRTFRGEKVVALDYDSVVDKHTEELTVFGRSTIAHELFHSIQYNSRFFSNCGKANIGSWIVEGSARAAGLLYTLNSNPSLERRDEKSLWNDPSIDYLWSVRDYSQTLPVPFDGKRDIQRGLAYDTASFWMYLAQVEATKGSPKSPGLNPYSMEFLAKFFNSAPSLRDCGDAKALCQDEVRWLDAQVQAQFKVSLREMYNRFIRDYALYGRHRPKSLARFDYNWLRFSFESTSGCENVILSTVGADSQKIIQIKEFSAISARCFEVNVANEKKRESHIRVSVAMPSGRKLPTLGNLNAVVADGSGQFDKAKVEIGEDGRPRVEWEYTVTKSDDDRGQLIILTNIADSAEYTPTYEVKTDSALEVTFTVVKEYMGFTKTGKFGGGKIGDGIVPLKIEFSDFRAYVIRGKHEKIGDRYFGLGDYSDGLVSPCTLNLKGWMPLKPGEPSNNTLHLFLRTEGPIIPGQYPLVDFMSNPTQKTMMQIYPVGEVSASVSLSELPRKESQLHFIGGVLRIDSVKGNILKGKVSGVAANFKYSTKSGKKEPDKKHALEVQFSVKASAPVGDYNNNKPYPCLASRPDSR